MSTKNFLQPLYFLSEHTLRNWVCIGSEFIVYAGGRLIINKV